MTHPAWKHLQRSDTSSLRMNGRHVIVVKDSVHGWAWRQLRPTLTTWLSCPTKHVAQIAAETWVSCMEEH